MQNEERTTLLKYILKEGFDEDIEEELNLKIGWKEKLSVILKEYKK